MNKKKARRLRRLIDPVARLSYQGDERHLPDKPTSDDVPPQGGYPDPPITPVDELPPDPEERWGDFVIVRNPDGTSTIYTSVFDGATGASAWEPVATGGIDNLPNVTITDPIDGQGLLYQGGQWVNGAPSLSLPGSFTGVLRANSGVIAVDTDVTDIVAAATTTAAGKVELATTAETTTGADASRAVTPAGLHDMTSLAGAAWFLDEDAMTSDSATRTVSQQSVKAYVDAHKAATSGAHGISPFGASLVDDTTASAARGTLGLGSMAIQNSSAVTVTGGDISGITDLAVADGGTGASTASGARTNLGLVIGTNVQAQDPILQEMATLVDPNVDRLLYWWELSNSFHWLDIGFGLDLSSHTLSLNTSGLGETIRDVIGTALNEGSLIDITVDDAGDTITFAVADAELLAIAGLTSAADRLPYFTGSGTASLATFTAAGRALVDDADAAAQRATLGLVIGTNVQAQDAELSAIAALISAANKLPYFTGSGTAALADLSAAGRALLDDADAAAQRATLGLVIGTDVQAQDAELAAIAGLVSAANKGIQFTGAGTAATYDLTAAGKALLDDADAAAQRGTLGLGSMATQNANGVAITGGSINGITDLALADGGTGASLADPGADRILFWDDSAGQMTWLLPGSGLTITGTTLDAAGVGGGSGITLIATQAFSAAASISVNNCFSATYRSYRIIIHVDTATALNNMNFRLRAAGVDHASANYEEFLLVGSSNAATLTGVGATASTSWILGTIQTPTSDYFMVIDLANPFNARRAVGSAKATYIGTGGSIYTYFDAGIGIRVATGFDGFTIFPTAGNVTGMIRVYGYED